MSIIDQIQKVRLEFQTDLSSLSSKNGSREQIRLKYLGRKGFVSHLFNQLGTLDSDERPNIGQQINVLKNEILKQIQNLKENNIEIDQIDLDKDLTLPGDPLPIGSIHPLTQVLEEIKAIFINLGFSVAYGPEIDTDFYNFEVSRGTRGTIKAGASRRFI